MTAMADVSLVFTRFLPEAPELELCISPTDFGDFLLSWPSEVGATYQLQSSDLETDFETDGPSIIATNSTTLVRRPLEGANFFRVTRVEPWTREGMIAQSVHALGLFFLVN